MKIILTFLKLLLSIFLQIMLSPLRFIGWIFKVIESICRVIKNTNKYLIGQIEKEMLN